MKTVLSLTTTLLVVDNYYEAQKSPAAEERKKIFFIFLLIDENCWGDGLIKYHPLGANQQQQILKM